MTNIKVFSKEWFKKYSKAITWVARLPILGELIFNFKKYGHYVDRKKVCEVTPNSVVEYLGMKGEKAELRQHFFSKNEYALRLQKVFYPIWITFHIWDIITRPIPQLNLGFDTLTAYSAAGANSPCDGQAYRNTSVESWSTIRTTAGNGGDATQTNLYPQISCDSTTDTYDQLRRVICNFDTSSIPTTNTVSSSIFSVYGNAASTALSQSVVICKAIPTSTSNCVAGDYAYSTKWGSEWANRISTSSWNTSGYNNFTFTATGKAGISKDGITSIGVRLSGDFDNSEPTWSSDASGYVQFRSADRITDIPKLVVTYTLAESFLPRTMWFN